MLEHAEVLETYMEVQYLQYYIQLITERMFYLMLIGREVSKSKTQGWESLFYRSLFYRHPLRNWKVA